MRIELKQVLFPQQKSKIKAGEGKAEGKYKFFTSSPIQSKFVDEANYDKPSLIFGTGGNASVHFCDEPFSTSTDCLVMYGRSETELETIYNYLKSNIGILENGFKGAGLKHISKDYILAIEIDLPSEEIQLEFLQKNRIIDGLIETKQAQLHLSEELVKSRFIEMFGDVITNTRGWKQYVFSEIATSRLGKMLDAKQQTGNNSFPYLANFNVQWFRFDLTSLNRMDFDEEDQVEFELKEGDLLVCEGGEIGRCAVWHNEMQPCYFQKALHRVRCNTEVINPNYMAWWFKYNCDHNGFAAIEGAKATIAHLPGAKLKLLSVTTPPIELQNEFASFIEQVDKSKYHGEFTYEMEVAA